MKYRNFKYHFFFLALVFLQVEVYSQLQNKDALIDKNVNKLIYSNPEQALYITQLLLSKPTITDSEKAKLIFQVAKSYNAKGDKSSSLIFLYQEKIYKNYLSKKELFDIEIEKVGILIDLSLYTEAANILNIVEEKDYFDSNASLKPYGEASISLERARLLASKENFSEGIALLNKNLTKIKDKFPILEIWYKITLGQLYLKTNDLSQSSISFKNALSELQLLKDENSYAKVFALIGLANVNFQKKEYHEAIKSLNEAYNFSFLLKNLLLQEIIINDLKVNYLATNDIQNYKMTTAKLVEMFSGIYILEQEAANSAFNLISEEQTDTFAQKESFYYNVIYSLLAIFLLIQLYFAFIWWRNYQRRLRLKSIIKYLEITRNNFINRIVVKTDDEEKKSKKAQKEVESKKSLIPKETEQQLLAKLKKFENSKKYTSKDISLAVLAGQFETNTKYLSEVINTNFHINFNTYINKLRINYIVDKIKDDPNFINYKISYLAEYCGFSSHSSFATVFKSLTGLSPVTFIDLVKNEKEILQENEI